MPIYNILKRGLRFPRLGTIRKGAQVPVIDTQTRKPKTNAQGEAIMRPVEKPYWVFHTDATQKDTLEQIYQAYGTNEIPELHVFLPLPDAQSNFDFWLEAYTASQLVARSDEQTVTYLSDITTAETLIRDGKVVAYSKNPNSVAGQLVKDIPLGGSLPYTDGMIVAVTEQSNQPITFKAHGRLQVVIAELGRLATWTVITGSYWYDIPAIYSTLELVEQITRASGRPANTIPLLLRRVPVEVSFTDEKTNKKKKSVKHFIELEPVADAVAGLLESYRGTPFAFSLTQRPQLSGPEEETYAEAEDDLGETVEATSADAWPTDLPPEGTAADLVQPFVVKFVTPSKRTWSDAILGAVVDSGFASQEKHAESMLNLSNLDTSAPEEVLLGWCDLYRRKRPRSGDPKLVATSAEAADFANMKALEKWGGMVGAAQALAGGSDLD